MKSLNVPLSRVLADVVLVLMYSISPPAVWRGLLVPAEYERAPKNSMFSMSVLCSDAFFFRSLPSSEPA
jgi:hypothetical protein